VRPDEAEARALINCGALDTLNPDGNRAALMCELACWRKAGSTPSVPKTLPLFEKTNRASPDQLPPLPADRERQLLRREFGVLGFLCDRHPMELYGDALKKMRAVKAVDLPRLLGKRARMAGWLITGKVVSTKHGDPMEFLTFEDETGIVETTFFPDRNRPYLLTGKVEADWGAITLTVDRVETIQR
jgi:DNA polymerase-3 subunit alpha/error-prone DNA polymerase